MNYSEIATSSLIKRVLLCLHIELLTFTSNCLHLLAYCHPTSYGHYKHLALNLGKGGVDK